MIFFDKAEQSGINIEFILEPKKLEPPLLIQLHLFRIVQELISNSIKHGKATRIKLEINSNEKAIEVRYEDDGSGLNPEKTSFGIGLLNMEN